MRMSVPSVKHLTPACRELFCGLLKVIVTEAEKLLLDWTPPTTCPLFLAMYVRFLGPEILTVFDMVIFCLTNTGTAPACQ